MTRDCHDACKKIQSLLEQGKDALDIAGSLRDLSVKEICEVLSREKIGRLERIPLFKRLIESLHSEGHSVRSIHAEINEICSRSSIGQITKNCGKQARSKKRVSGAKDDSHKFDIPESEKIERMNRIRREKKLPPIVKDKHGRLVIDGMTATETEHGIQFDLYQNQ